MSAERQNAHYQAVTDKILAKLNEGVVPWQQTWNAVTMPRNAHTGRPYRGANVMMTLPMLWGFTSPLWATVRQINQMGGKVVKGQTAAPIVFFRRITVKDHEAPANGNEDGVKQVSILKKFSVFNLEQTEGVTLPTATATLDRQQAGPFEPLAAAEAIVDGYAHRPTIDHGPVPAPCYSPERDAVTMPPAGDFVSKEAYYAELFHELSHSTGHPSRLDRHGRVDGGYRGHEYGREELIAEMAAAFLNAEAGIEMMHDASASYIDAWRQTIGADNRAVVVAAAAAQRAADHILGREFDDPAE